MIRTAFCAPASSGTNSTSLGFSWRLELVADLPGETWWQLQLRDGVGKMVNICLWVSSFRRFRLVDVPEPLSAELRNATLHVQGVGPVRAKHVVLAAYKSFPEGVLHIPLAVDCCWGATLQTAVQLIPSNLSRVRLTELKRRPTSKLICGIRTLTRLPGHIVWRRHLSTWSAMALLRDKGWVTLK